MRCIDEENGQHLPITFAVKLSPDGVVQRQEIVAYREARGDEVRDARFRNQFVGKSARDPLLPGDDIVAVSGATISSRAMAVGVKRALVLFEELLRPTQAAGAHRRRLAVIAAVRLQRLSHLEPVPRGQAGLHRLRIVLAPGDRSLDAPLRRPGGVETAVRAYYAGEVEKIQESPQKNEPPRA